jgi:hypothetical protein
VEAAAQVAAYYADPAVRARMAEYREGALGLAAYGGRERRQEPDLAPTPFTEEDLELRLEEGADICRSLADARGTLVQLDVDYVNPSDPVEPYREPGPCFERLEPVYDAVRGAFGDGGLEAFELMTGRGYHFTTRALRGSPLHRALERIGSRGADAEPGEPAREAARAAAHRGAGRLMEAVAHAVAATTRTAVPLTLADVPPPGRGPFICLDLSAYGDPVRSRYSRTAFSSHQKPSMLGLESAPFVIALPRGGRRLGALLDARGDPRAAARLAATTATARIPDATDAPEWLWAYDDGVLAWFHRRFDDGPRLGPRVASDRYARIPPPDLPLCVRTALADPNPQLLVPTALRAVTLVLWSRGWHPSEIADLVRSRYEDECGWGGLWARYDPGSRAEFYVRLFAGAVVAGLDHTEDFTCQTQQRRGGCPGGECGHELGRLFPGRAAMGTLGAGW